MQRDDGALVCDGKLCERLPNGEVVCQEAPDSPDGGVGDGDDGGTVVREKEKPDGHAGKETEDGCKVAAVFAIEVFAGDTSAGVAKVPRNAKDEEVTEVTVFFDREAIGRVKLLSEGMATYPGRAVVSWKYDGKAVIATGENVQRETFEAGGATAAALEKNEKKEHDAWVSQKLAFRFKKPAKLGTVHPVIDVPAEATVTWVPENRPPKPCSVTRKFNVHWVHAKRPPRLGPPTIPKNPEQDTGGLLKDARTSLRTHTSLRDNTASVVQPFLYFWGVKDPKNCCGKPLPYHVIQFARASIESSDPRFQKGKDFGLDISEAEKGRAAKGESYDPTLTNKPRQPGSGTQLTPTGNAGNSSMAEYDAPGMSEVLYDQLSTAPGKHVFRQQFFAFLVCDPGGQDPHDSKSYLLRALVVKAAIFTITWTFDNGRGGVPKAPTVTFEVNKRADLECAVLEAVLAANELLDAYKNPTPAELKPMDDAGSHDDKLENPPDIKKP